MDPTLSSPIVATPFVDRFEIPPLSHTSSSIYLVLFLNVSFLASITLHTPVTLSANY